MKISPTLQWLQPLFTLLLFANFSLTTVCMDLILYCLSPSVAYAETTVMSAGSKIDKGRELLKAGQYQESLGLLSEAAAMDPANPIAFNYLGEAYFRLKRYQEAVDALNKAVSLDPDYLLPHIGLGMIYELLNETEKAKKEFEEAVRIGSPDPGSSEIKLASDRLKRIAVREHLAKGRSLYGAGKIEESLAEFNAARAKDENNPQANLGAGMIYKELKQLRDSFDALKKVIEVQPGNVLAHLNLGELHATAGALEEAIASFREVLRLAPAESAEAKTAEFYIKTSEEGIAVRKLFEEATGAMKDERYDELVGIYKKILEMEPANSFALYNLGVTYYKSDRLDDALDALKKSIEINPKDLITRFQLATVYDKMGKFDEALTQYEIVAALELDREEVKNARDRLDILKRYAAVKEGAGRIELLIESGDVEAALKEVERLLSEDDRNEGAHLLLARIQVKTGDLDKAFVTVKKALSIRPDYWDALILLGQIFELQGKYSDASDAYRAVMSGAPRTKQGTIATDLLKGIEIPIHFQQAKTYLDKGDYDGALKAIGAILDLSPDDPVALYNAGILYYRLNMLREAAFYLNSAVEKRPDYVQAHLQLGLVFQAALAFEQAENEFKKVLQIEGEGKEANIAKLRLGIIKEEEAFVKILMDANRFMRMGNFVKAQQELEDIISFTPNNHIAHFQLSIVLEKMDRREDALNELKRSVEIKPDYAIAYLIMARLYEEDNFFSEAKNAYRKAIAASAGGREGELAEIALKRLRNWRIGGSMSHSIDSNIAYGATKRTTGISTGHGLNLTYGVYTAEKMKFTVDLSVSRSLTYSSQLFGMNYGSGLSWYHKIRNNQTYGINADYNYSTFLYKRNYEAFNFSANSSITPDIFLSSLSLSYSLGLTRSFTNKTSDADTHSLSFSLSKTLSLKDSISGSYSFSTYLNRDPIGSNYANRSHGFSLSYSRTLKPGLSVRASYSRRFINYSNPDSTTLFTQFRRNTSETLGLSISYRLSERVDFSMSVNSINAETNLPPPSAEERLKLADILAAPIPTIGGGYEKETVSMGLSFSY